MPQALVWEKMTVREVRDALQHTQTVLIPIGVTEQHGYHLALNTDMHNAWQMSVRAAAECGCFVAPMLPYTFSGGELPGTINVDYHLVALLVTDILRALAANGCRNLIIVLGHGGTENCRATREAAELFLRQHPAYADRKVAIYSCWELSELCARAFAEGDFHAGYLETSLMLYWAPEDVRLSEITLDEPELVRLMREDPDNYQVIERPVDFPGVVPHIAQRPEIKVGVMGDPSRASAELGAEVCADAVARLVALIKALEG
jgi:creatinine amidohydrolase